MTWTLETSNGNETGKIRFDALPYCIGAGLDVGCGPWKAYATCIGIDGQAYPNSAGPSLVMDCTDLSLFADAKFNFIFSSHFLEHVKDTAAMLAEWWRLIKVGGHLVLYLPHKSFYPNVGQPGANPDHKHDFMPADIIRLMREMKGKGWDLLRNEERNGGDEYSFFQVYRKRADKQHTMPCIAEKPAKTAAIVRPGNFGDAIWATSVATQLKKQGYHVTAYVEQTGEHVLRNHPDIDEIVMFDRRMFYQSGELFAYIDSQRSKFDKYVDFTQSIEADLLFTADQPPFNWPQAVRHTRANKNYVEWMHEVAQVPYELQQRVYNTDVERQWAKKERAALKGRVIVLANTGSTAPKWWPYGPGFCQIMAKLGVHVVVVGDLKGLTYTESAYTHVIGNAKWSMRESIAFAKVVDAVVGQETGLLNAVAVEPVPKVVMLGHSSVENLTRDWLNTESLSGNVACYPCHQIHYTHAACPQEERSKAAQCQAAIKIESVIDALVRLAVLSDTDRDALKKPQQVVLHRKAA